MDSKIYHLPPKSIKSLWSKKFAEEPYAFELYASDRQVQNGESGESFIRDERQERQRREPRAERCIFIPSGRA